MLLYTLLTAFSSKKEKKMAFSPDEIKDLRKALGLTQMKFAKKLGTNQIRISRWEKGKESPSEFYQKKLYRLKSKIEEAEKYIVSSPKPVPTQGSNLYQSKENIAWTPEAIQNLRRLLGWTQDKLATALLTNQPIVAQWEAGKYRPSEEHQNQLDFLATQLAKQMV